MSLVHEPLAEHARRTPNAPFIVTGDGSHTFAEVDRASSGIAAAMRAAGVGRGDRVAILLPNSAAFIQALFGILKAGAVVVPINPDTPSERLVTMVRDCGATAVVATTAARPAVREAVARAPGISFVVWAGDDAPPGEMRLEAMVSAERDGTGLPRVIDVDLAAIMYTSGSTGVPKGVMLDHRNLVASARSIATYLDNQPSDLVAGILPMSFGYGLQQVLVGAHVGYAILVERSFAFPLDVMRRIAHHRVTGLPGVPSMFAAMLQLPGLGALDLSSVRYVTNAAADLPVTYIPALQALFPAARVFCMYGLTECTRVSYLDPARLGDKSGSVGTAIPNMEAWTVAADGSPAPAGVVGELVVRGSGVMQGYWGRPEETAAVLRPGAREGDRVLHTGDLFRTDDDGYLYFVGRTDDVFKSRGEKVAPREVEQAIYEIEGVAEVVVIGVPHELDGQAVKAIVVPRDGIHLEERTIRRHCRARLASHLVPRFVEIQRSLPRTASGKVLRAGLK